VIRIGIAGIGFIGMIHYHAIQRLKDARVAAICTRDPKKRAGDWRSIQGNFGPRGKVEKLKGVRTYERLADMYADPNLDLIDLCLPTAQHPDETIRALNAGKHVLVEKPIALQLEDGRRMMAAADAAQRKLFVAHVLPFFPGFSNALELASGGRYGKVLAARLNRIISKPDWRPENTAADPNGGAAIDLHIHDTHFIQLLCGVPKAVFSRGIEVNGNVEYLSTQYIYDDRNLAVSCDSGAVAMSGRSFTHGFELYMEQATLLFQWASMAGKAVTVSPLTLLGPKSKVHQFPIGKPDPMNAFVAEIKMAIGALNGKGDGAWISGAGALSALTLCHREVESVRTGQIVTI